MRIFLLSFKKSKSLGHHTNLYLKYFTVCFAIILQGCSYTRVAEIEEQRATAGGTGVIRYSHDILGPNKHLLTITATPGVMETEGSIAQRIHIFAHTFASRTCIKYFEFIHDPNFDQSIAGGFMKRTKSYVFTC
jgi:hypothetical protein